MVILSGARCRFACGPADATATHYLLLQLIQIGFTFLVLAHPGTPRHSPEDSKIDGVRSLSQQCVCGSSRRKRREEYKGMVSDNVEEAE